MKFKHNKKRNTAFLFEAMIKQLTLFSVKQNKDKILESKRILTTYFNPKMEMGKELKLYQELYESKELSKDIAERVLLEIKSRHSRLDKKKLFNEQTHFIQEVNENYGHSFFNTFTKNYKNIATIFQVFNNDKGLARNKAIIEQKVIDFLVEKVEKRNKIIPIDNLLYKTVIKTFNTKYNDSLLSEQKELLGLYITSFNNNGQEFKVYLNETLNSLREKIIVMTENNKSDEVLSKKIQNVQSLIESFAQEKKINNDKLVKVLQIQEFINEFGNNKNDN